MAAWATPSTHGAAVYETLLYADGQLSCNCPAWFTFGRGGRGAAATPGPPKARSLMCWRAVWPARAGLHGPRHAERRRPAV
jgi:hypothetical protein